MDNTHTLTYKEIAKTPGFNTFKALGIIFIAFPIQYKKKMISSHKKASLCNR